VGSDFPGTLIRDDSQGQLKKAVDELGFRYIRFHAIFHDVLGTVRLETGKIDYDWAKIDQLYDDLLARRIKPFVDRFGEEGGVCLQKATMCQVHPQHTPTSLRADPKRTTPVSIPVIIRRESLLEIWCNTVNISEGGMALSMAVPLVAGEIVRLQFTLPDHTVPFLAESAICGSKTGQLGIRFVSISDEQKAELQLWLSQKLEETFPEFVSDQFRESELCLK
jgi:hypothetical protein